MIYTLENGLQTLTDTLKAAIERLGVRICTSTPATSISFDANNKKAKVSAFILKGARFPALIFNISTLICDKLLGKDCRTGIYCRSCNIYNFC